MVRVSVLTALLFLAVCVQAGVSAPAQAGIFDARNAPLENGMEVVFIPNHRAPVVTHMVWVKAGAVDEPPGVAGLAHFLEHLMFKGTKTTKPGEFSRTVKSYGATHNAFTSKDFTAYFESVSIEYLDDVMRLNADRLQNLGPPEDEVLSEKQVVLEERRQRVDNNKKAQFREHLYAAYYLTHPYANPVIGWMGELERMNWDQAKAFYDQWYVPNNMFLVVTGDLEFEEVIKMAERHYGSLRNRPLPDRPTPVLPNLTGEITLEYSGEDIHQNKVMKIYTAPSYADNKQESLALQVLEEMINGEPTTYLHDKLVVEDRFASSVSVYYSSFSRYQSVIAISAIPNDGVTNRQVDRAIQGHLATLAQNGFKKAEMEQAKQRLIAESVYARDSLKGPAMIVGRALSTGVALKDIEQWDTAIEGVREEQVMSVLKKYLVNPERTPATGFLSPAADQKHKNGEAGE